ncbi:6-hydroxymethylpterin diphosphokinase MptE-like protein [Candidatus Nitrosotalea bavarica]|uniref:6-hydroxymethylpterin diphosphokinase MptE-like protein n=1 Tax=Candidatus Nitrosotalea bavarica TaxID=1903277 RepID=UPI000C70C15A|nr:6-hydroxymethylpterin diphosphokinase MptE-like protein [Candidatus Nitrosotalea bavarica]
MTLNGWEKKYQKILNEFDYDRSKEIRSANILNSLLKTRLGLSRLEKKIKNKTVFIIGAGPSLGISLPYIKKFKNFTKIVADGVTQALIENKIRPDIVVTDLDGNMEYLKKASDLKSVMIVHAHGDNINKLPHAISFRYCIGTTEDKPFGKIRNFGGFTDGDRCVFLANHFGASKIILIGMDFGIHIGKYSKVETYNKSLKLKKLKKGKSLLEWLAQKSNSDLYTTSQSIIGFKNIKLEDLQRLVR